VPNRIGQNPCGPVALADRVEPAELEPRRGRIVDDVGGTTPILAPGVRGLGERRQIDVIEYLQEENRVLREQLGGRRLRFTDGQRRRLAAKGRAIGRRALEQLAGVVTPDTILRWYRELIAKKYDGSARRQDGGRATTASLHHLVVQFATGGSRKVMLNARDGAAQGRARAHRDRLQPEVRRRAADT
jgi:hypothetical protein